MSKSAIDGATRGNLFYVDPNQVKLAHIDFECEQGDVLYNPRNLMPVSEDMVTSIMRIGVLEPISVKKNAEGELYVVFGNQRIRAAREANKRLAAEGKESFTVPCLPPLRGFTEGELSEVILAENEIRQETKPLDKAELAVLHLRRKGGNTKEAAKAFGVTEQYFKQLLTLREATEEVKEAVRKDRISASAAAELASLDPSKQKAALEEVLARGGTIEVAKHTTKKAKGTASVGRPSMVLIKDLIKAANLIRSVSGTPHPGGKHGVLGETAFWTALQWVTGELDTKKIPGLAELVDRVDK